MTTTNKWKLYPSPKLKKSSRQNLSASGYPCHGNGKSEGSCGGSDIYQCDVSDPNVAAIDDDKYFVVRVYPATKYRGDAQVIPIEQLLCYPRKIPSMKLTLQNVASHI